MSRQVGAWRMTFSGGQYWGYEPSSFTTSAGLAFRSQHGRRGCGKVVVKERKNTRTEVRARKVRSAIFSSTTGECRYQSGMGPFFQTTHSLSHDWATLHSGKGEQGRHKNVGGNSSWLTTRFRSGRESNVQLGW